MEKVLIIDDDPSVLAAMSRAMRGVEARVQLAATLAEAQASVRDEVPAVVICDYRMPDGDGLSFIERLQREHPGVRCLLHTGEALNRTGLWDYGVPVLLKPCPPEEVRQALLEQLEGFRQTRSASTKTNATHNH